MSKRVAIVPGDDAVPEAVYPTPEGLRFMDLPLDWTVLPDGETMARETPREERERLIRAAVDACDTVPFGATSGKTGGMPDVKMHGHD